MKRTKANRKRNGFFLAFLIVAFVFLAATLGSLGSFYGTGGTYELRSQSETDTETPSVTFYLSEPKDASGNTVGNVRLTGVYLNVAAVYGKEGTPAVFSVRRSSVQTFSSSTTYDGTFENFYTRTADLDENGKPTEDIAEPDVKDGFFRFVSPFKLPETWKVRTYHYLRLSLKGGPNVLLNEVVFVGERLDEDDEPTGERYLIPAEVREATPGYVNESTESARLKAAALVDAQAMPPSGISSFDTFSRAEIHTLMTISEIRRGSEFAADAAGNPLDVYHVDNVHGALGTDLIALGTLMFGMSPFGLRFFPALAAFGALVVLSRLCAKLMKSEKAGLVFALLYALSCLTLGYGHLGTPVMIGVFFFACSLSLVYRFYARGMEKAAFGSALPVLFGGLFGAAAICVNGAFVVPMAGVVALFAAGMVRQKTAKRYRLEKLSGSEDEAEQAAKVLSEFRFKDRAAVVLFCAGLLLGTLLLSLLGTLPMYFTVLKAFDSPASPTMNIFGAGWRLFANGFAGSNFYGGANWIFRTVFGGTGAVYGVTALVVNPIALAAAIFGACYGIGRLIALLFAKERGKAWRTELRRVAIPLAGLALSAVMALAVAEAGAFILLTYLFGFLLAASFFGATREGKEAKAVNGVGVAGIVLLALGFAALGAFVFSIPLPAAFLSAIL